MIDVENNLIVQEQVVTENRAFIVTYLDAEDVIDELIQERLMGRNATQRLQLAGTSRGDKNRVICDQLTTAGPDAVLKFCKILRDNRRQVFIAERLEKSEYVQIQIIKCGGFAAGLDCNYFTHIAIALITASYS